MTGVVLALDSSTGSVSVAVASARAAVAVTGGEGALLAARTTDSGNHHVELLVPLAREVLAQAGAAVADVRAVAVGVGPGPFTGTRVGVVTALTLGAALGVPVTGVCSLDVLALGAVRAEAARAGAVRSGAVRPGVEGTATEFLAVTDARRREVYWARYEVLAGGVRRVEGPSVDHPAAVPRAGELPAVGAGAVLHADVFGRVVPDGPRTPDAAVLAVVVTGSLLPPFPPEPLYLRRPDARPAPPPVAAPGIAR